MGDALFILMTLVAWILVPSLVVLGLALGVRRIRTRGDESARPRPTVPGIATGHHRTSETGSPR